LVEVAIVIVVALLPLLLLLLPLPLPLPLSLLADGVAVNSRRAVVPSLSLLSLREENVAF